ncbi:hypothetical protein EB796_020231 [Bugula neritina]|uniref:Uncharacterized protein n=1 Tax=Bugula neritina TaxID=10212 RepID=A0A7J7J5H2_BUGNE|nr:hypothetical protein EB796_020231 [Bugula neritina]
MPTLRPSLSYATQLGLTITCIVIFSLLFLFVYVQLWMILYYKHKKEVTRHYTLVLLVAFFSQVVIKAKYPQSARIYK